MIRFFKKLVGVDCDALENILFFIYISKITELLCHKKDTFRAKMFAILLLSSDVRGNEG